jgi:hypothetical protein
MDDVACQDSGGCSLEALVDCCLFGFLVCRFFASMADPIPCFDGSDGPLAQSSHPPPPGEMIKVSRLVEDSSLASKCLFLSIFLFFTFIFQSTWSYCTLFHSDDGQTGALWTVVQLVVVEL